MFNLKNQIIMKKTLMFLAAACMFAAVSCDKTPQEVIPEPAHLAEFGFLAAENPVLMSDLLVSHPGEIINLSLPVGTSPEALKSLVPYIGIDAKDAVVTINGESVIPNFIFTAPTDEPEVDGETKGEAGFDFSEDVDVLVTIGKVNTAYTVRVTVSAAPTFSLVASLTDSITVAPFFAINPVNDVPYVCANLTSNDAQMPIVYKFENGSFAPACGSKGAILPYRTANVSVGFDNDGEAYLAMRDYKYGTSTTLAKTSIVKLGGTEPKFLGDTSCIVYPRSNYAIFGENSSNLWVAYSCGVADNGIIQRGLELAHWAGESWEVAQAINGRAASDYAYYNKVVYGKDGNNYLFIFNQNVHTVSLYKYVGDGFTTVFEGLKPTKGDGTYADKINLRDIECAVDANGTPYVLVGCQFVSDTYNAGVIKVTENADHTPLQTIVGGIMTDRDSDSDYTDNWSLAVDNNGTPFFAYTDADDNLFLTWIDNSTKAWASPAKVAAKVENPTLAFTSDNTAYICGVCVDTASPNKGRVQLFMGK